MPNDNIVDCNNLEVYAVTEKAIRLGPPGIDSDTRYTRKQAEALKVWIPLSFIERQTAYEVGEVGDFEMPQWVADKNELEYE